MNAVDFQSAPQVGKKTVLFVNLLRLGNVAEPRGHGANRREWDCFLSPGTQT